MVLVLCVACYVVLVPWSCGSPGPVVMARGLSVVQSVLVLLYQSCGLCGLFELGNHRGVQNAT